MITLSYSFWSTFLLGASKPQNPKMEHAQGSISREDHPSEKCMVEYGEMM